MKINKTLTALIAGASIGMSGQAFAGGTDAGTLINNSTSLSYKVGAVDQLDLDAVVSFKVDNRVDMTLTADAVSNAAKAYPGEAATYSYTFKNDGNNTQRFKLGIEETLDLPEIDLGTITYALVGSPADATLVGALTDELVIDADAEIQFTISFTYPLVDETAPEPVAIVNGDTFKLIASATAYDDQGTPVALVNNNSTNKNTDSTSLDTEYNVFAEDSGTIESYSDAYNGIVLDHVDITIETVDFTHNSGASQGPGLSVLVVNDPLCGGSYSAGGGIAACVGAPSGYTPKAIPGAMLEYTITATNSGEVTAEAVAFVQNLTTLRTNNANDTVTNSVDLEQGSIVSGLVTVSLNGTPFTGVTLSNAIALTNANSTLTVTVGDMAKDEPVIITFTALVEDGA